MSILSLDELAPTPNRHDRPLPSKTADEPARTPIDTTLTTLLEDAGRNVERSALLLRELLAEFPEHATLAEDLAACEREGDRITHDIIYRLGGAGACARRSTRATAMRWRPRSTTSSTTPSRRRPSSDLYGVEAPMEQAVEFADVLVAAGERSSGRCAV